METCCGASHLLIILQRPLAFFRTASLTSDDCVPTGGTRGVKESTRRLGENGGRESKYENTLNSSLHPFLFVRCLNPDGVKKTKPENISHHLEAPSASRSFTAEMYKTLPVRSSLVFAKNSPAATQRPSVS